jgi:hypothetical protein
VTEYKLTEAGEYWEMPLEGREVTQCCVDYEMRFRFWKADNDTAEVRLPRFRLREPDGTEHVLEVEKDRRALAPALDCFGKAVERALAWKDGRLELAFTDGTLIEVAPHEQFEAWQVTGPGRIMVVCLPGGGEPAIWE